MYWDIKDDERRFPKDQGQSGVKLFKVHVLDVLNLRYVLDSRGEAQAGEMLALLAYRWSLKVILSSSHDLYRRSVWGHYCSQQRLKMALAGVHLPLQGGKPLKFTQSFFGTVLQMEVHEIYGTALWVRVLEFTATSSWFDFPVVLNEPPLILFSCSDFSLSGL